MRFIDNFIIESQVERMRCCDLVLFLTAWMSSVAAVDFVSGPDSLIVPIGGTAQLKCVVDLHTVQEAVTLYWYKAQDGGGYYITGGSEVYARNQGAERYSLETSSLSGKYSYILTINAVEAADSGQYQCMGVDAGGSTRSSRGTISVVQAATNEPLTCSYYPESPTVGQTVTFSCVAPRGISPEMLSWWMSGTVRIQPSAHLSNNHGISFVKTLDSTDNFAEFTCLVGTSLDAANHLNCSVMPLAVPIRAEVTPQTAIALPGGTATFRCRGTAIPAVTKYRWIVGPGGSTVKFSTTRGRFTVITTGDSSTLTVGDISMQDNDMTVRCVVLNDITKTITSVTIQVTTHIPTTVATSSLVSSPVLTKRPIKPTNQTQPTDSAQSTPLVGPSQPTTTIRTTGKVLGSPKQRISTTSDNGDVILGCDKDCEEGLSHQQSPDSVEGSRNGALAAVLSILAICALATGVLVYLAYIRRRRTSGRVTKRKMKNKPMQRLRSLRLSVSTLNPELVNPDSVRLKTIEVLVNPPPPEWKLRVKDVESEGREPSDQDLPRLEVTPDCDVLYAKPDKTRKKRHHGDNPATNVTHPVATAPPAAAPEQYLLPEAEECFSDDVSDASTWDMSSVDSGCEEEVEGTRNDDAVAYAELDLTMAGERGKGRISQTETVEYENGMADAVAYAELDLAIAGKRGKERIPQTETVEYENSVATKTSLPRN